jgi:spore coat polysaccharide biosynthesis protein SpsF
MKIVAIVQARMGSTRLPGKVRMDIAGEPMLTRVMNRLQRAQRLDEVRIATTTNDADDVLESFCRTNGWPVSRGSEDDVLDRYHRAAIAAGADHVVRVTSDCPLIDPGVVDDVVAAYLAELPEIDYAANTLPPRTFPRGLDVEVFSFAALLAAAENDANPAWREHVTPYLYRTPGIRTLRIANDVDHSDLRWTVDTPEDLQFVREVYARFGDDRFSWRDVLELIEAEPELSEINRDIRQKEH